MYSIQQIVVFFFYRTILFLYERKRCNKKVASHCKTLPSIMNSQSLLSVNCGYLGILPVSFFSLYYNCIFSRKLKTRKWVLQTTSSYSYGQDECPQGTSPSNNCMNEWLGEPVLIFQLPGRGILRNFINNLVINNL